MTPKVRLEQRADLQGRVPAAQRLRGDGLLDDRAGEAAAGQGTIQLHVVVTAPVIFSLYQCWL